MKKILLIVPVMLILILVAVTTNFTTKENETGSDEKKKTGKVEKNENHSCCASSEEVGSEEFSENSIYLLDSKWTNQSGSEITLASFNGKPVVLTMFFASCTYACPILLNDMKKIESSLPEKERKDFQFILVSIDHERDTPERLNQYAKEHNLDLNRWSLLSGSKDQILELAAVLGFKYKKDENGEYSHSNLINVLNDKGEVIYQHTGLNKDVTLAANKLKELNRL